MATELEKMLKLLSGAPQEDIQVPMLPGEELVEVEDIAPVVDPVTEQKVKQDIVNTQINSEVASPNADLSTSIGKGAEVQEQKETSIQDLMKTYLSGREGNQAEIKAARESDAKTNAVLKAVQALTNMEQSGMQARSGVKIAPTKFAEKGIDTAAQLKSDREGELKDLLTTSKIQEAIGDTSGLTEFQKQTLGLKERELDVKEKAAETKAKDKPKVVSKGQEVVDKEFGKEYVKWKDAGKKTVDTNISNIDKAIKKMEDDPKMFSGPVKGAIEAMGFETARKLYNKEGQAVVDLVNNVSMQDLKKTLGGQFAEKEALRLMNSFFNASTPKIALERLKDLSGSLKTNRDTKQGMVDYYNKNKASLQGYEESTKTESPVDNTVLLQAPDGQTRRVNRDKAQKYLDKGAKIIGN